MICFNDYLKTDIGGCASLHGSRSRAYLMPRSNINWSGYENDTTISFTTVTMAEVVPCFMDMTIPYKLSGESTRNDYGLTKHNKTVELFLAENTALSQKQILQLQNEDWILIMFDNNLQKIVVGYERGLRFVSSSQELSSTDTHGGIVVTMTETAVNIPMLFVDYMDIVPVQDIAVEDASINLSVAESVSLAIAFTPANASITDVIIEILNPLRASGTRDSPSTIEFTGIAPGVTVARVFSKDGNFFKEIQITVTA